MLTFEHNGVDFDADTFQSLCRFGFSNKRRLHTIGFRGIGFKSTFSLGPRVEVFSPTLAVSFAHQRFTQPEWIGTGDHIPPQHTTIRVVVDHEEKLTQMVGELRRWSQSPIPLLFFRSVRQLSLQDETIQKCEEGPGPVSGSMWMRLVGRQTERVLYMVSDEESFPAAALDEIRAERGDTEFDLPPCRVELVLHAPTPQRAYVVLPTEIELDAPFSCNAPFVQDPARTGIKAPTVSPTNEWLLGRVGRLAARTLLTWLSRTELDLSARGEAYSLIPPEPAPGWSTPEQASRVITDAFTEAVAGHPCLLTHDGQIAERNTCIALPSEIHDVWAPEELLDIFAVGPRRLLARELSRESLRALKARGWVDPSTPAQVADRLSQFVGVGTTNPKRIPRPNSLDRVLTLWDFLQSRIGPAAGQVYYSAKRMAIVPCRGDIELRPAADVLVASSKESSLSEDDWQFLTEQVTVADPQWIALLYDDAADGTAAEPRISHARALADRLGLQQRITVQQIFDRAVSSRPAFTFHRQLDLGQDEIRLARIAAHADLSVRSPFMYLCRDGMWRTVTDSLLSGLEAQVIELFPSSWLAARTINEEYHSAPGTLDQPKWLSWATNTTKSGLLRFPLPTTTRKRIWFRSEAEDFCRRRGATPPTTYRYVRENYEIVDHDFDDVVWRHLEREAQADPHVWERLVRAILAFWSDRWDEVAFGAVHEVHGSIRRNLDHGAIPAAWVHRLRGLECMPDAFGRLHRPAELLRNTPDTAPLIDIEPFLAANLDRPEYSHVLDLLGVRHQPANAEKLVERIRALAQAGEPPLAALANLYRALDRVTVRLPAEELAELRVVFANERLIRTDDGAWAQSGAVYVQNTEELPEISTVMASVSDLILWERLNVARQPSLEGAVAWVDALPRGSVVRDAERRRVRLVLRRAPHAVWTRCQAWLDLSSRWVPRSELVYGARTVQLGERLFEPSRHVTADLSMLEDSVAGGAPFADLAAIETQLVWRVVHAKARADERPGLWMQPLGLNISRALRPRSMSADDDPDGSSLAVDREVGRRLAQARWQQVSELLVAPHLKGVQVGPTREQTVAWQENILYARGSGASDFPSLIAEVSRHFQVREVKDAIAACIDRDPNWINAYFQEQFDLMHGVAPPPTTVEDNLGHLAPPESYEFNGLAYTQPDASGANPTLAARHALVADSTSAVEDHSSDIPDGDTEVLARDEPDSGARRRIPTLTELFAAYLTQRGFGWSEGARAFVHTQSGAHISRTAGLPVWTEYDSGGRPTDSFWITSGDLQRGLKMPAEVWTLFESRAAASNVVFEEEHALKIYPWSSVRQMITNGDLESLATDYLIRASRGRV